MNILAIGAHFDDVELGCGGTLAKHAQNGDNVYVYVATVSGFSNQYDQTVRSSEIALKEAQAAMKILGVKELICGKFKTLEIEFVDELNIEILKIVQDKKIPLDRRHSSRSPGRSQGIAAQLPPCATHVDVPQQLVSLHHGISGEFLH
jgi:hypothetical protein